jgi:hypothetical protein
MKVSFVSILHVTCFVDVVLLSVIRYVTELFMVFENLVVKKEVRAI